MANLFGTGINQVPTNGMLGNLAFQDKAFVSVDKIGIGTTAVDTGTANQTLQNYGGAFISGNVGIGITNPQIALDVVGSIRVSGITTLGITTITNLTAQTANVSGVTTVGSLNIGATQVISSGRQLQNIASLDATTTATIESAIANAPNTFTDLNVTGITTVGFITATNIWNAGITTSSRLILNGANDTTTGGGQIYLNGATGNRIDFNNNGVAAPSFTTRSAGTKIVLNSAVGASTVDYAFGIETATLWSSVASSAQQFRWYAGTTQLADLKGTGELVIGSTSLTGTTSQRLQVTGGGYFSGSVGIGTTNPTSTLQVGGDITITPNSGSFRTIGAPLSSNTTLLLQGGAVSGSGGNIELGRDSNNYYDATVHLFRSVDGSTEYARFNNSGNLLINSTSSTGTSNQRLQVTGGAYVSGNLGIANTNPGYTLDVGGNINFSGSLFRNGQPFTSGIGIGSTSINPGSGVVNQRIGVGFTDINIIGTGITITGYGSTVVIDFRQIAAGSAAGANLSISTITSLPIQDIAFVGGASTTVIGIATATDPFVYDPVNNRVGIGTSTPAYKLDVVGDINSSTSVKIQGVDVLEEAVRLAIAFG